MTIRNFSHQHFIGTPNMWLRAVRLALYLARSFIQRPHLIIWVTSSITACTLVGSDYQKPSTPISITFKEAQGWKIAQPQDTQARGDWWQMFGDTTLNTLIAQVNIDNQTIKQAEAQYRQAQALLQQAGAAQYPTVTAGASIIRSRPKSNVTNAINFVPNINSAYNLNTGISWEPDLWGKVRRSIEAGKAGEQASAADVANIKLSVQAQLAQTYFQLRMLDLQKKLMQDTEQAYSKSLQLVKNQYAVGIIAKADVMSAETQLNITRAQSVDLNIQRSQLEHAIATLIGKTPADFSIPSSVRTDTAYQNQAKPLQPPALPAAIPSQLLERRPDIAAAERRVAQANANIGVAQAAYYPDLTLSASTGYQSTRLARWLNAPSRFWSFGPTLAYTVFDGGTRQAQKAQATAAYDAQIASYRQTVLTAFQEVEDQLASLQVLADEANLQQQAVQSAQESLKLTTNQYQAGTVSYLNVINAQTTALNTEKTALQIYANQLTSHVQLIKALGGGWKGMKQQP